MNVLNFNRVRDDYPQSEEFRELLKDKESHPNKYRQLELPYLFERGHPLEIFVDPPMHLILLGVCKCVFRRLSTWSARRGRRGHFLLFAKKLLKQIDDLKLSWLLFVPKTFSAKWGGWVSKHYASLTRVALWVYGTLMTIDDTPPYEDPVGDPTKWKVPEYKAWLKARGLDITGNKPDLQPRVMNYLLGPPSDIPPIQPERYGSATDMLEMLKSMVLLVSTLFQDQVQQNSKDIIDLRIRIFLTRFNTFDAPMRGVGRPPTWLSSYNFLCLQNLPSSVHEFGPARKWFEGKWLGERYVSCVKQERSKCPPKNLYSILMRNLHRRKAVEALKKDTDQPRFCDLVSGNTRIYGSEEELETTYTGRTPLPFVILTSGVLGCLYYEIGRNVGKDISVRILERTNLEEHLCLQHGLCYWNFELTNRSDKLSDVEIKDYGVLLPKLGCAEQGVYTMATKSWSTEMFGDYDFATESANYNSTDAKIDALEDTILDEEWI